MHVVQLVNFFMHISFIFLHLRNYFNKLNFKTIKIPIFTFDAIAIFLRFISQKLTLNLTQ